MHERPTFSFSATCPYLGLFYTGPSSEIVTPTGNLSSCSREHKHSSTKAKQTESWKHILQPATVYTLLASLLAGLLLCEAAELAATRPSAPFSSPLLSVSRLTGRVSAFLLHMPQQVLDSLAEQDW